MHFILGVKEGDHPFLFEYVNQAEQEGRVKTYEVTERGITHRFRFLNQVPLNASNQDELVNFVEYWEIGPQKTRHFSWVTDFQVSRWNVMRIKSMVTSLLQLIAGFLSLTYLVLDGHFGNNVSMQMVLQCHLHLISKLRHDSALYFPFEGTYRGHGPHPKFGEKLDCAHIPDKYLKQISTKKNIQTRIYQAKTVNAN